MPQHMAGSRERGSDSMAHCGLETWVSEVAALTSPDQIVWCDGSVEEKSRLISQLVADGTLLRLNPEVHPSSYYFRSDVNDVARVENRTFICSAERDDAGPTNNWVDPAEMHATLEGLFQNSMRGRTMYVVPYLMGPPGSPLSKVGVEITDSAYVVLSMRIMTRMGAIALRELGENGEFSRGLHCTGQLDPAVRYISHFPDENLVMSFSSNYGGNALLGKKCFALRLASVLARKEGWLAEHMLILGLTDPQGRKTYVAAAFPSACGKTNLAMIVPPENYRNKGWKVETIGDDIAWLKFGGDGRLYAVNPEAGFFGVAPGTSRKSNPNAMEACSRNTIFTNVGLRDDGTVWWEGMSSPPAECTDWKGERWTPDCGRPCAHPNSRFTAPAAQCPSISPEWENPSGVPISAIIFGGRRSTTMPLVFEAFDWQHGVYLGATMASEKTAAAAGDVGELRHDPMAMLPFCGYHMGDYWQHWLNVGRRGGDRMPRIFHVNWFRKDAEGRFLWPGFGSNMQVLEWVAARCHGEGKAVESPIGWLPGQHEIDFAAAGVSTESAAELMSVRTDEWRADAYERAVYFRKFGNKLPQAMVMENDALIARLVDP